MKLQKFRWSKVYESQEEELVRLLTSKNTEFKTQDIDESGSLEMVTDRNIALWCAEGSFKLEADGQSISMQPGDAVPIQAATKVNIHAGMSGCTIYESAATKL
jgi:mannose-6-phosphate isomerase class I